MKVLIGTACNWNPGDEFIRDGLCNLLPELGRHEVRYFDRNPRMREEMEGVFEWPDLYLHAGSPAWYRQYEAEYRVLMRRKVPYAFVAVGASSMAGYRERASWMKEFVSHPLCLVLTARDATTLRFCHETLGACRGSSHDGDCTVHGLPCSAYFYWPSYEPKPFSGTPTIALGVPRVEHFERDVEIFKHLEREALRRKFKVRVVCHERGEAERAKKHLKTADIFFSEAYQDYRRFYASIQGYMGARVHGAIPTASYLRPALHLGVDERRGTCDDLALITNLGIEDFGENRKRFDSGVAHFFEQMDDLPKAAQAAAHEKRKLRGRYNRVLKPLHTLLRNRG